MLLGQVFVCTTFVVYVSGALYGMTKIVPRVEWRFLVPHDDIQMDYMDAVENHFLEYPPPVQVTSVTGDIFLLQNYLR